MDNSSQSSDRWLAMAEQQMKQLSVPTWFLGTLGAVLSSIIIWVLIGIASDAANGHTLAVKIEGEQKLFTATLAELKSDIREQKEERNALNRQILELNFSSKTAAETMTRQGKILEALGSLTYRVDTLENEENPPAWIGEQLKDHTQGLKDLRTYVDTLSRENESLRRQIKPPGQPEN